MDLEPKTEPNVKQAVPFFRVSSIEASVRYYVDGLGFEMTQKWMPEGKLQWCWLERGGAALMLQEFRKKGHDSWVPEGKLGEGVSICFICEDALAIYREVTSRGIQAARPFVGNGMRIHPLYYTPFHLTRDVIFVWYNEQEGGIISVFRGGRRPRDGGLSTFPRRTCSQLLRRCRG